MPRLIRELGSDGSQARSQALHTLSKIGDPIAWPEVSALVHDQDDEVARSAWRAAVALVPSGDEGALARSWPPNSGGANSRCSSVSVEL